MAMKSPLQLVASYFKHGDSLVEMLIVVVIIGILAAIAVPKFANTRERLELERKAQTHAVP